MHIFPQADSACTSSPKRTLPITPSLPPYLSSSSHWPPLLSPSHVTPPLLHPTRTPQQGCSLSSFLVRAPFPAASLIRKLKKTPSMFLSLRCSRWLSRFQGFILRRTICSRLTRPPFEDRPSQCWSTPARALWRWT